MYLYVCECLEEGRCRKLRERTVFMVFSADFGDENFFKRRGCNQIAILSGSSIVRMMFLLKVFMTHKVILMLLFVDDRGKGEARI